VGIQVADFNGASIDHRLMICMSSPWKLAPFFNLPDYVHNMGPQIYKYALSMILFLPPRNLR
jgi:hypothetical protein